MIAREYIKQEVNETLAGLIQSLKLLEPQETLKVILFGSFVRDDFNEGSDIDIVVIKETTQRFIDRAGEVLSLYRGKRGLEVLVYTPAEFQKMLEEGNPFIRQVVTEGKVIYE
jgi:predicted nucleotidyltransferase